MSTSQRNSQKRPTPYRALCLLTALFIAPAIALAQGGLSFGGSAPLTAVIEDEVEERVEESVAEEVSEQVEEQVEEKVEELSFGYTAQRIEESVEEQVEESIAEVINDAIDDSVAGNIEDDIENSVEEAIEEEIEQEIEQSIEDSVAQNIEESVESSIEESVAENVEDTIESNVEESVASTIEDSVEQDVEQSLENDLELVVEQDIESEVDESVAVAIADRLESQIDDVIESIESELEIDEDRIHKGQWLVMAEPDVFAELADEGYLFDNITELPGLGMLLADVAAPSSFDITETRQGVIDVVGTGRAEVDLNHIYAAGTLAGSENAGIAPRAAIDVPGDTDSLSLKIGMIDSEVDVQHPSLDTSRIQSRSFVAKGGVEPQFHGTAIASIIAANDDQYRGLAPNAELYSASVFETDEEQGEIASTISLVRALDWLLSSGVEVVNISLAGPPNRLLEKALERAAQQDIVILAAAGNGGPVAKPMYPAAYNSVIAVTAVDASGQVFRLANRGSYLDIAAPGVDLLHARAGGGYAASSGTSFAVPFASTAAARLRQLHPAQDALGALYASAEDLGPPGPDEIYGHGLLKLTNP